MTETVVKGMTFVPYLSEAEITKQVNRVAREIVESLGDEKSPIFVCVLNGAYVLQPTCSAPAICQRLKSLSFDSRATKAHRQPAW